MSRRDSLPAYGPHRNPEVRKLTVDVDLANKSTTAMIPGLVVPKSSDADTPEYGWLSVAASSSYSPCSSPTFPVVEVLKPIKRRRIQLHQVQQQQQKHQEQKQQEQQEPEQTD